MNSAKRGLALELAFVTLIHCIEKTEPGFRDQVRAALDEIRTGLSPTDDSTPEVVMLTYEILGLRHGDGGRT